MGLVPVAVSHQPFLLELFSIPDVLVGLRMPIPESSPDRIVGTLASYRVQMVATHLPTQDSVGWLGSRNIDHRNGVAKMVGAIHPLYDAPWRLEVFVLFSRLLFAEYSLRKVYLEVPDFVRVSERLLSHMGIRKLGTLHRHERYLHRWADVNVFEINRSAAFGYD